MFALVVYNKTMSELTSRLPILFELMSSMPNSCASLVLTYSNVATFVTSPKPI